LAARLRPIPVANPKRVASLLADLDSDEFQVRAKAQAELEKLGETVAADLLKAAKNPSSAEAGRQIKSLLDKLKAQKRKPSSETVRLLRSLEVLEQIGTLEARQLLKKVAAGASEACLTQEARASLERLTKRGQLIP
jgi:hypothetical protein